ncbi:MAG: ABC transporter ATP-binding protein [Clostridia bacterium]|nr:ABC transporter ATP-binding protein [Clostridia bacterium]
MEPIIEVKNVTKIYKVGNEKVIALDDVSFKINKGDFCCLLGSSGSGKSTLLNLMAGIEKITKGDIFIKGKNVSTMGEHQLAKFRQKYLGFVFQSYNLITSMNALENVALPLIFKEEKVKPRNNKAKEMLIQVGLGERLKHRPNQMSGGQQQRVGIARAFVSNPEIVFADEPTGNLDSKTSKEIMELIKKMATEHKQTIVMVTHDESIAAYANKIVHIHDGQIEKIVEVVNNEENN